METLSNLASAATQAVWPTETAEAQDGAGTDSTATRPDPHSEPLSGATGNTARGEPYDAGNQEEQDAANAQAAGEPETKSDRGSAEASEPIANRGPKAAAKEAEHASAAAAEPKGPGPKPIEEVAREHHGDAGRAKDDADTGGDGGLLAAAGGGDDDGTATRPADHGGSFGGPAAEQGTPVTATSRSSGEGGPTGTVAPAPSRTSEAGAGQDAVVPSSGLQADGGDFDAARSGAGLEAERLLEQKGWAGKHGAGGAGGHGAETSNGGKEKKSLGEKIKAKMHRKD